MKLKTAGVIDVINQQCLFIGHGGHTNNNVTVVIN